MTGTYNVLWTLECLGSSSDGQETGSGEQVEKSGEKGGPAKVRSCIPVTYCYMCAQENVHGQINYRLPKKRNESVFIGFVEVQG